MTRNATPTSSRTSDENTGGRAEKELRLAQRENSAQAKRIAQLERALADVSNQARGDNGDNDDPGPRPPRGRPRLSSQLSNELDEQPPAQRPRVTSPAPDDASDASADDQHPDPDMVAGWGAKFALQYALWLVSDEVFSVKFDENWRSEQRFERKDGLFITKNLIQGQLRELLELVPEEYHRYRATATFKDSFKHGMQLRRQHFAKRIRTEGTFHIFGGRAKHMRTPEDRFAEFAKLIGYQGKDGNKDRYTHLAPILGTVPVDRFVKYNIGDSFTNTDPQTLAVGLLRGGLAAQLHADGNKACYAVRGNEIQEKFHVKHMSPGFMANVHVLMRWALSADSALTPIGNATGINWRQDYNDYLWILLDGLDRGTAAIRRVFRDWDKSVFGTAQSYYGGTGIDEPEIRAQENEDVLQQLEAASEDEMESEEEQI